MTEVSRMALILWGKETCDSLALLIPERKFVDSVCLLLIKIDQLAWMSVENDLSGGEEFKGWVDKYLLPEADLKCDSADLWGSRCALLHQGTAEGRDVRKGNAKAVHYFSGTAEVVASKNSDICYVSIAALHVGLISAADKFFQEYEQDRKKWSVVQKKASQLLAAFPLNK